MKITYDQTANQILVDGLRLDQLSPTERDQFQKELDRLDRLDRASQAIENFANELEALNAVVHELYDSLATLMALYGELEELIQ